MVKILSKLDFAVVSRKGSHVKMQKNELTVIIPLRRLIAKGTLLSILDQAKISREEFSKFA
ncbi:MAG: type II toxin-antitoxin system HicA family toxin [Candidatus Diapherotrites archaeon]|nr:type II toxin-antitoxin system HicA family toxin [Candidatus Diapherotrites archaeon]